MAVEQPVSAQGPTPASDDGHGLYAERPTEVPPRGWKDVLVRVKNEMRDDHSSLSAAGVAFFGFLAFIPGLAALVSVYGLLADPDDVADRVESMAAALPADAKQLLVDQLSRLASRSPSSLSVGLAISVVIALWSASSGMAHLAEAIGVAYDEEENRGMIVRRAMSLLMTVGLLVVGGVVVAGAAGVAAVSDTNEALGWVVQVAAWIVVALLFVAGLAILYRHSADRDEPKWRWATPGALVALVVWIVITIGFRLYVASFSSYDQTYGSLAGIVIMLFWLYLSALVIIFGAQLNAELEHQTAIDSTKGPDLPLGHRNADMADTIGERT